jgi:hypothetical protein
MLWRSFGSKMEEVAGVWRRLHNEEYHNLYLSPNVIRMMKTRRVSCKHGEVGRYMEYFDWRT